MHTEFCMQERMCKTILHAQKSVHANIKFVEPCLLFSIFVSFTIGCLLYLFFPV